MCGGGGGSGEVEETLDQREMAKIMAEKFKRYRDVYEPVEKEYFNYADKLDGANTYTQGVGMAHVSAMQAIHPQMQQGIDQMTAQGIDPNSGAFKSAINAMTTSGAKNIADKANKTQMAISDNAMQAQRNIVAIGNNQQTQAIVGMDEIARYSGEEAGQKAISEHNSAAATEGMVGTIGGAGYRTYEEMGRK